MTGHGSRESWLRPPASTTRLGRVHGPRSLLSLAVVLLVACTRSSDPADDRPAALLQDSIRQEYDWVKELAPDAAVLALDQILTRNQSCTWADVSPDSSVIPDLVTLFAEPRVLCETIEDALDGGERVLRQGITPAYTFSLFLFQGEEAFYHAVRLGPFDAMTSCETSEARLREAGLGTTACRAYDPG